MQHTLTHAHTYAKYINTYAPTREIHNVKYIYTYTHTHIHTCNTHSHTQVDANT
jgi:hypothetical protein